jgi:putative transposase
VTNEVSSITEQQLVKAWYEEAAELLGDEWDIALAKRHGIKRLASEMNLLDEQIRVEVRRRFAYVHAVLTSSNPRQKREAMMSIINEVKYELKDVQPPSVTTLYRWCNRYAASSGDLLSLAPAYSKRGNTKRKLVPGDDRKSNEVAQIINTVIEEQYLSRERPTVATTYDAILIRIDTTNEHRETEDQLPIPHRNAVYRVIKGLDPFLVMKARYGEHIAKQKYDPVQHGPRPTRPLERVEIDHTKIDLLVVDPVTHLPVGRPWLTSALDKFSRVVLGQYISFNPPSYLSVMHCLRHAIAPKTYVKDKYPTVVNTWDTYGVPELIVVDNGPEFHSTHFEDACLQLGISVHYAPPKQGKYKGSEERWFRTQNKQLLHHQPGTTFSNVLDRAEYDPKVNAVITMDALDEMYHVYIIDVYHQQEHRGIRDVPARLWREGIAEYPPALPPQRTALDVLLGCVVERVISAKGIELHGGIFYNDDALAILRRNLKPSQRVTIKYDPSDLSLVHVADRDEGIYIPVPATNQAYAQGLSLWQHEMIKRFARQRIRETVDIVALSRAKQKIQEIVKREWLATKRTSTRQRLARALKYGEQEGLQLRGQATGQDRLVLIGGNISPTQSLLGSERASSGISDFASNAPATPEEPCTSATGETATGKRLKSSGKVKPDLPEVTQRGQQRQHRKSRKAKTAGRSEANSAFAAGDEELDMTGWKADYDLPS